MTSRVDDSISQNLQQDKTRSALTLDECGVGDGRRAAHTGRGSSDIITSRASRKLFFSKVFDRCPNVLASRKSDETFPYADIQEAKPNTLVDDIAREKPILQPLLALSTHLNLPHRCLLHHDQLPELDQLLGPEPGSADLAGFFHAGGETVDDDDAAFAGVFVMMMFMVGRHGLTEDVRMKLTHVGTVTPDTADVSPFPSTLMGGEIFRREERFGRGCAHEDGVRLPNVVLEHARVLAVFRADHAEFQLAVHVPKVFPFVGGVDLLQEIRRSFKGTIDDIDMVDLRAPKEESESYVPFGLFPGAEHQDGVNVCPLRQDHGRGQCGPEGGELFRIDQGVGGALGTEQGQGSSRSRRLG